MRTSKFVVAEVDLFAEEEVHAAIQGKKVIKSIAYMGEHFRDNMVKYDGPVLVRVLYPTRRRVYMAGRNGLHIFEQLELRISARPSSAPYGVEVVSFKPKNVGQKRLAYIARMYNKLPRLWVY